MQKVTSRSISTSAEAVGLFLQSKTKEALTITSHPVSIYVMTGEVSLMHVNTEVWQRKNTCIRPASDTKKIGRHINNMLFKNTYFSCCFPQCNSLTVALSEGVYQID